MKRSTTSFDPLDLASCRDSLLLGHLPRELIFYRLLEYQAYNYIEWQRAQKLPRFRYEDGSWAEGHRAELDFLWWFRLRPDTIRILFRRVEGCLAVDFSGKSKDK